MRAIALDAHQVYTTRGASPAPARWLTGVGDLLNGVAEHIDGREAVVVLGGSGAELLGLPTNPEVLPTDQRGRRVGGGIEHPAQQDAERAGWSASNIGDWSTFTHAGTGKRVRLAIAPLLDLVVDKEGRPYKAPFYVGPEEARPHSGPVVVCKLLDLWGWLTGTAWYGTPGMAGMQIMSDVAPKHGDGKDAVTWKPKTPQAPDGAFEDDYRVDHWRGTAHGLRYVHAYDANRMYIAAATAIEVCPWTLKHTKRTEWNPRLAGWWQVELAPWQMEQLPNPAGYVGDKDREKVRWVTAPTMALLHELAEQGVYGGVRVLDSWTGPARKGVLKPFAARMSDAYRLVTPERESLDWLPDPVVERVRFMLKTAGREVFGLLDKPTNWAYRPDWWYSIIALARANLFRKMWAAAHPGDGSPARWPVQVDVDNVFYPSDERDAELAAPTAVLSSGRRAFSIDQTGVQLGAFKVKKTYEVGRRNASR